jgi:hypothetical protein
MRWHPLVCCLALLPLGGAGCARHLPPVDQVAKVRVTVPL